MTAKQLKRAATDAHRRGQRWTQFWDEHANLIRQAVPYDRQRRRRLVNRLLSLVVSGNTAGQRPVPVGMLWGSAEPWEQDDAEVTT
jgi:hypothetical protein